MFFKKHDKGIHTTYKAMEKRFRHNDEALRYLRCTGTVYYRGRKYYISKKDRIIANIGKENYRAIYGKYK